MLCVHHAVETIPFKIGHWLQLLVLVEGAGTKQSEKVASDDIHDPKWFLGLLSHVAREAEVAMAEG